MTKQLSPHAHVAKLIRQHLKEMGIKGRVTSNSYSGGSSVSVELENQPREVEKAIEAFCAKFEYGHFDGMNDIYEYSNRNDSIPQVKFLFVNNTMTDDFKQTVFNKVKAEFAGCGSLPDDYTKACNEYLPQHNCYVSDLVYRTFKAA